MSQDPQTQQTRSRVHVRVSELIKFNINAAIRDRQMKERAFVELLADAVRIFATLHPEQPQPADLLDLDKLKEESDPNKWGQKAIGERIGRESGAMWRILNPVEDGGNAQFDVLELLLIAADLQAVSYTHLTLPTIYSV